MRKILLITVVVIMVVILCSCETQPIEIKGEDNTNVEETATEKPVSTSSSAGKTNKKGITEDDIIGTWKIDDVDGIGNSYTFREDGTGVDSNDIGYTWTLKGFTIKTVGDGSNKYYGHAEYDFEYCFADEEHPQDYLTGGWNWVLYKE